MRAALAFVLLTSCSSADGASTGDPIAADTSVAPIDTGASMTSDGFTAEVSEDSGPTTYPVRKIPGLKSITY
jgi:hypothetical protein